MKKPDPTVEGTPSQAGIDEPESETGRLESDGVPSLADRRSIMARYLARHGLEAETFARHLLDRCLKPGWLPWIWRLWPHSRQDLEFLESVGRADDWKTYCKLQTAYCRRQRRRHWLAVLFCPRLSSRKLNGIVLVLLGGGKVPEYKRAATLADMLRASRPDLN